MRYAIISGMSERTVMGLSEVIIRHLPAADGLVLPPERRFTYPRTIWANHPEGKTETEKALEALLDQLSSFDNFLGVVFQTDRSELLVHAVLNATQNRHPEWHFRDEVDALRIATRRLFKNTGGQITPYSTVISSNGRSMGDVIDQDFRGNPPGVLSTAAFEFI